MAAETLEFKTAEAWDCAMARWYTPSIPPAITPRTAEEIAALGTVGTALQGELAFMKYPEFQTYVNLSSIAGTFPDDPQRGLRAVETHEVGHRFCPYDTVTSLLLRHTAKKQLESEKLPYSADQAANTFLNLFTDMCINTKAVREGEEDIHWAYQQLSKDPKRKESKLWRVYARSMELAWGKGVLPEEVKPDSKEEEAAAAIAALFERDVFDKSRWRDRIQQYTNIMSKFLEEEQKDKGSQLDDSSGNIPKMLDEKTAAELAKRLAEIGSDGLPGNPQGLKEFKEILAGYGQGDPKKASITFYDTLSNAYDVTFARQPFGRPRVNPFQPVKWTPSMGVQTLDVDYSVQTGGRIIPGVTTYSWRTRKREVHGGFEEVVPDLDLYLDSSMSMPDPVEEISLPVLASFVAAKKAHRKGVHIRATNFSGEGQSTTVGFTRDLYEVFETLVIHYNGGTVFPTDKLSEGERPKHVLIITDTFVANEEQTAAAISGLIKKHKRNGVTIYAISPQIKEGYLRQAGAMVVHDTTPNIFKRVLGTAEQVYTK